MLGQTTKISPTKFNTRKVPGTFVQVWALKIRNSLRVKGSYMRISYSVFLIAYFPYILAFFSSDSQMYAHFSFSFLASSRAANKNQGPGAERTPT